MSSGGGGGLGCTGAMGAVLVVAMVATLAGELAGPGAARGGVSDPGEGGRRLAFRLLEELDHEPRAWTGDPLDLAAAPIELLWLPDLPMGFHDQPDYIEEADPLGLVPDEEPIDHRALRGLVDYVARGGDLVLPLGGERTLDLAERLLGLEADLLADGGRVVHHKDLLGHGCSMGALVVAKGSCPFGPAEREL